MLDLAILCKNTLKVFEEFRFFGDTVAEFHEDQVFAKLFTDINEDFDSMTQQALEIIFHVFLMILETQCVDQFPRIKYRYP